LRRIVFLTDPPPDEVLPAAMLLGADVKTESLSADALARLPDLAPEFLIVDAMTDPERAFGLLSVVSGAGSTVPVIVVVFPDGVHRHPWHEVADEFVYPNATEAELGLRLEMIRSRRGESGVEVIRLGPVTINVETYQAIAAGRPLDLTYKEFELMRYLAQNPGRVFTRASLLREVWGYDFYGGTRTVDVHVRRLRAKLGPEHEHLIETVRGVGYRAADVSAQEQGGRSHRPFSGRED
jgi:DNA-binding response OmpR family regulator